MKVYTTIGGEEMEYTVSKLARISGVSARTLRYYDEIDLLKPKRINSSGYRIYGQQEVDILQQILFYRELEMKLDEIKNIIKTEDFSIEEALENHLIHLSEERNRLNRLIETVEKSLQYKQGGITMSDQEKFEAFKKETIQENEEKYGKEIREKYGDDTIDKSNNKFTHMTQEEYNRIEAISQELNEKLAEATKVGNPSSELGQEVAALHKEWLIAVWPDGLYDAERHFNLSLMYVEDPRFKDYYEKIASGAAEYLNEALKIYLDM